MFPGIFFEIPVVFICTARENASQSIYFFCFFKQLVHIFVHERNVNFRKLFYLFFNNIQLHFAASKIKYSP